MNTGRYVALLFCSATAVSYAVPAHYFDQIDELVTFPRGDEVAGGYETHIPSTMKDANSPTENITTSAPKVPQTISPRQAATGNVTTVAASGSLQVATPNSTTQVTARPPQASTGNATSAQTTIRPPQASTGNATAQATTRPPQSPTGNTTAQVTTRPPQSPTGNTSAQVTTRPPAIPLPGGMLTTTRPPTASPTMTTSRPNQMVSGNCTLGDDILNVLFNRTSMEHAQFTLENSLGVVGSRLEIINAIMNNLRNHSLQEIEACLDLYRIPVERPVGVPEQSGSSHLIYQRPGYLGGLPTLPVPQPDSSNFIYGHGYTTYIRPFNVAQRVPGFRPAHRYLRANSLQDLFQLLYTDFASTLNLYWQHGTPAYWFDRNAAPRRPG